MARFEQTIDVAAPVEEAFRYVADFTTAAEWDPGIVEARRVNNGPPEVGATWDALVIFRGRRVPLRCQITEFSENKRILFVGQAAKARSVDEITFEPAGAGTRIACRADLTLKGAYRLAEPFLGGALRELGTRALAGLKAKLDAGR